MSDPDLTPEQDESVRALLASAKHADPMPPDVAARLDAVLADLASERREVRAPVVTLASRRRRRVSGALLAAAAVVVLGVGVTQVLPTTYESSDSSAGAGSEMAEDQDGAASDRAFDANQPESAPGEMESQQGPDEKSSALSRDTYEVVLDSRTPLRRQVRSLPSPPVSSATSRTSPECLVDPGPAQDQVEVTYDGTPGVLVYRPPAAGRQQVDLFLCGEPDSFASVTIKSR